MLGKTHGLTRFAEKTDGLGDGASASRTKPRRRAISTRREVGLLTGASPAISGCVTGACESGMVVGSTERERAWVIL
mgnify:CR=1 FL=1